MDSTLAEITRAEYGSVADVAAGLEAIEEALSAAQDRRAVFATAYLNITRDVQARINWSGFHDSAWVARYLVAFANLYREALHAFAVGRLRAVPRPWRLTLRLSQRRQMLTIQDLILGINAHINHDMPLALLRVGIDPHREQKQADHGTINEALWNAIGPIQARIAAQYAPGLAWLDTLCGPADELLTQLGFVTARNQAWQLALTLADAPTPEARDQHRLVIEHQAALMARKIVTLVPTKSWSFKVLHDVEQRPPRAPSGVRGLAHDPSPFLRRNPLMPSMADLIEQLQTLTARLDGAHSRLAAFASAYILVSEKIQARLHDPSYFEDPAWIEQVAVQFGQRYFAALAAFEAGQRDQLADCWKVALEASTGGATTLPQILALHMNARLNYDLAIALEQAGVGASPEEITQRERDFKRIFEIFRESIDEVQALVARKYSAFVQALDALAGPLDEAAVAFTYRKARDGAWANAMRLAQAATPQERAAVLAPMDAVAAHNAEALLLKGVPGAGGMMRVLVNLEERFS